MVKQCVGSLPDRDHSVYRYTDQIYKIVQFKSIRIRTGPGPAVHHKHYENKLASSLSRARRVILEKALCNPWDWFCTFTIAKDKYDRKALDAWWESFSQWLRDKRKLGHDIRYLIVPERHKDGSWHGHGLIAGIPEDELIKFKDLAKLGMKLPRKLRNSNYFNWVAYQKKFGFCSLGKIVNPVAAGFYITKYITKEQDRMVSQVGLHSYYVSRGLAGATKHIDFYGRDPEIDKLLVNKYEFCSTGMTHTKQNLDWTFCLEFGLDVQLEPLDPTNEIVEPAQREADQYFEWEQTAFFNM